jgi:hypothetical protein
MRLIWPTRNNEIDEAASANVSDRADASNATRVDKDDANESYDANKSNNDKFDCCCTKTIFPLFMFSQSPSQNVL